MATNVLSGKRLLGFLGCFFSLCTLITTASSSRIAGAEESVYQYNTQQRAQWNSNRLIGSPDPPDEYTTESAFPHLKFEEPIAICQIPGTRKFCLATRQGKIFYFDIDQAAPAELLIDFESAIFGLAFHPDFQSNGQLFVTNIARPSFEIDGGARVVRLQINPKSLQVVDETRREVISWKSGGHNGGCIRFGPDGMLYISVGDGSGIADQLQTGQDISDLGGSILRIDVNTRDPDVNYRIPNDNPFRSIRDARPEVWALGLRHAWKFNFDQSGRLWAGDVGQDLWEGLYLVEKAGNYGWSILEGGQPFRPDRSQGPGKLTQPVIKHSHSEFRSITAGFVYHSSRIEDLRGHFVYGDYDTGKIWAVHLQGSTVVKQHQLADTQLRIVEFAQDDLGEVYIVDFVGGGIHRLIHNQPADDFDATSFPRLLSQTGLFSSTADHQPAQGVIPYSVNAPLWSDNAIKDRFIAIPGDGRIVRDAVHYPHSKDYSDLGWKFPDGTVLVKTFSLALDEQHPERLRRIETRLLQFQQMPGDEDEYGAQRWQSYTYLWNREQTDAELVEANGCDIELTIRDSSETSGIRHLKWHLPSRAECALCHTMGAKYVLGVTTLQMNKDHDYGQGPENQLEVLSRLGIFSQPLEVPAHKLPRLIDYRDEAMPLHLRARACLHANCAHCHRKWGGGNADFELQASIPLLAANVIDTRPGQGGFGLANPRILVPGRPDRSLIWKRMSISGLGRMPHIGSSIVDQASVDLVHDWIVQMEQHPDLLAQAGAINPRLPKLHEPPRNWALLALYIATAVLLVLTWLAYQQRKLSLVSNSLGDELAKGPA